MAANAAAVAPDSRPAAAPPAASAGVFQRPTLRSVLGWIGAVVVQAAQDKGASVLPEPPSIPFTSRHYQYALYVAGGEPPKSAAAMAGVSPRTVEHWRRALMEQGRAYFGREKTYEWLVGYCLDEQLRAVIDAEVRQRLRAEAGAVPGVPGRNAEAAGQAAIRTASNRLA